MQLHREIQVGGLLEGVQARHHGGVILPEFLRIGADLALIGGGGDQAEFIG